MPCNFHSAPESVHWGRERRRANRRHPAAVRTRKATTAALPCTRCHLFGHQKTPARGVAPKVRRPRGVSMDQTEKGRTSFPARRGCGRENKRRPEPEGENRLGPNQRPSVEQRASAASNPNQHHLAGASRCFRAGSRGIGPHFVFPAHGLIRMRMSLRRKADAPDSGPRKERAGGWVPATAGMTKWESSAGRRSPARDALRAASGRMRVKSLLRQEWEAQNCLNSIHHRETLRTTRGRTALAPRT